MSEQKHLRHPQHFPADELRLSTASKCVIAAVGAVIACYVLSLLSGWTQHATALIVGEQTARADAATTPNSDASNADAAHAVTDVPPPPLVMVVPFILMLAAIAVMPMLHGAKALVGKQFAPFLRRRRISALTVLYYALAHQFPIVGHFPAQHLSSFQESEPMHLGTVGDLLANAHVERICAVYRVVVEPVCGERRHSHRGRSAGPFHDKYGVLSRRRAVGQFHWHNRRGDGADPPAVGNQSRAKTCGPHGDHFHFHRLQLRRLFVAAGRSAAVFGLSARRAVFVDDETCGKNGHS